MLTACGASIGRPATVPSDEPIVSSPLVPLPPPSPLALLAAVSGTIASQVSELPCPPPNLPPALAGRVDCAAMKRFADATVYAQRDIAAGSLPPVVDLRAHRMVGPVKDQQDIGACAGFAMTTVLDNAARRAGRSDVVSPLHMFATYARSGEDFSRSIKHRAFTTESIWPFDSARACRFAEDYMGTECLSRHGIVPGSAAADPVVVAERDQADRSSVLRVMGYEEMSADPDQLAVVIASGEAIWVAFEFQGSAWNALNNNAGSRLAYYPPDTGEISHAVTLEGYRTTPSGREFLMHNSWGTQWGQGGFAWISEAMVRTHFRYGYRVMVVDASVPPPPRFEPGVWLGIPPIPGWSTVPALPSALQGLWPAGVPRPF